MGVAAPARCVRPGGADGDTYPRCIGNNLGHTDSGRVCQYFGDIDTFVIHHRDCKSSCVGYPYQNFYKCDKSDAATSRRIRHVDAP